MFAPAYGFSGLYGLSYGASNTRPASTGEVAAAESEMLWQELQLSDKDERKILDVWAEIKKYLGANVSMATLYANMPIEDRRRWNERSTPVATRIAVLWTAAKRLKPSIDQQRKNEEALRAARAAAGEEEPPPPETGPSPLAVLAGVTLAVGVVGGAVYLLRRG